jgi:CAAX prenyl protease-like protein
MADSVPEKRPRGHGWGAYFWPFVAFMLTAELADKLPPEAGPYLLPLKVVLPAAFLIAYAARGHYPELRGYPYGIAGLLLDFAMGLVGAALWMAPYLFFDSLRPDSDGFDPNLWGPSLAALALFVRAVGYGVVTPFMEELFVRSWLARYIHVFDGSTDFRDVPIGTWSRRSFIAVVIFFTFSHVPWEWPVAVAWVTLTQLWLYQRRHLMSLVVVHAGSNLGILVFVILQTGRWLDSEGNPISLWFFV